MRGELEQMLARQMHQVNTMQGQNRVVLRRHESVHEQMLEQLLLVQRKINEQQQHIIIPQEAQQREHRITSILEYSELWNAEHVNAQVRTIEL